MRWSNLENCISQRADHRRRAADGIRGIIATGWTWGNLQGGIQFDVRGYVVGIIEGIADVFVLFEGCLPGGGINLPQVVDAGVRLRIGTGIHEVWNRNGREQSDNAYKNRFPKK